MEFTRTPHNTGVAKAGLTTGIIGTSLGALGILGAGGAVLGNGGLFGNRSNANGVLEGMMIQALSQGQGNCGVPYNCGCSENHLVDRYEAQQSARIAELETQVALRDSNTYTDQKLLELYQYVDGRMRGIEGQIAQQAVLNQATNDKFQLVKQEQDCCCARLEQAIANECKERRCADNSIVNYVNTTFYPKLVADITTGTTTTPQTLFNPIPSSNCGCDCPSR